MNISYVQKYLKYKKKNLKIMQIGGILISSTKELDNKNIGTNLDKETFSKIYSNDEIIVTIPAYSNDQLQEKIIIPNDNIKSQILESGFLTEIIYYDRGYAWVLNYDKIYIDEKCKTEFYCKYKFMYYTVKRYTPGFNYFEYNFTLNLPQLDLINSNNPIDYPLIGSIYNKEIDLFNSVYNYTLIIDIVGPKIENCFSSKLNSGTKFKSKLNDTQLFFMNKTAKEDKNFKIHMGIKLEKIFWVINKLLDNLHQFEKCMYAFKVDLFFPMYRLANQFSNRSHYDDTYVLNGETFKTEEEQPPNFVFYPLEYKLIHKDDVHIHAKNIIDILKELFPDELNVTSGLFPRSNFRINDSIYFAVGDFLEKNKKPEKYTAPFDYNTNDCLNQDEIKCNSTINHSKNISNHELCYYENNTCMPNNVNQYKSLIYTNDFFSGKTTREIYKMVEQENIYDLLTKTL